MAVDMFVELEGVSGETKDKAYKEKKGIDILAWSWGMSQSGSAHVGGGAGAGKASFQDISFTKYVDKSTPTLMQFLSTGKHIVKGCLTVRKAGSKPLEYIKIKLNEIMISSLSTGGSGGEDRLTENVSLNFAKFEFIYTPQKEDGTGDTEIPFKYDIAASDAET